MMRLRDLTLHRFGRFTEVTHDFGPRPEGSDFHIIHGPNEAGKTTTMEAVLRLFFGFPRTEPYGFRHGRANLRLSATVEVDGASRRFVRLPGRLGSLTDGTGTPLPETSLSGLLGGLTEADYRNLLCLDDATLEKGGEEIAQARGDIGRLLFSAAAGVADISQVLEGLRTEADALWRKRAQKTELAELRRQVTEVEAQMRSLDVSANQWKGLKKSLSEAQAAEARARALCDDLRQALARTEAARRALPALAEADRLSALTAPYAAWPARLEIEPEALVQLLSEEAGHLAAQEALARRRAELIRARDALARDPSALALAPVLTGLQDLRARARTAALDLPRRREGLAQILAQMSDLAQSLGARPEELILDPGALARLEAARAAMTSLPEDAEGEALSRALALAEADLARLTQAPEGADPGAILSDHDAETLLPQVIAARAMLRSMTEDRDRALAALTRGTARFDSLPPCPVTEAQVRDWITRGEEIARRRQALGDALASHRSDAAARRAEAQARAAHLPADAEALAQDRDALWQEHRASLTPDSADRFHAAMRALDAALQSRIEGARDLGALRALEAQAASAEALAAETAAQLMTNAQEDQALRAERAGLGLDLSPQDWRDWLRDRAKAAEAQAALDRALADQSPLLQRGESLLVALAPLVGLVSPDLASAVARARALADQARQAAQARGEAQRTRDRIAGDLARHQARRQIALAASEAARAEWAAILPGLPPQPLAPLHDLRALEASRQDAARRIAQMEEDAAHFAAEMARLAPGLPPETAFDTLTQASRSAAEAEAAHADLSAQIARAEAEDQALSQARAALAARVAVMAQGFPPEAPTSTLAELRQTTSRAADIIALRAAQAKALADLSQALGMPEPEARAALHAKTPAALEAEAARLTQELQEAEAARTTATEARVTAAAALAQVSGDGEVARLAETRAMLELQMEAAARRHLELHLGHRLAETAIRRYRDSHRSGMLSETERLFAILTRGAYPRLVAEVEGEAEVLLALDAQGAAKRAAEMSKGTRFQLYLALRAAAQAQMADQGLSLPFFCDDIFETFDEERTASACLVMEEIGRRGQAIYLTHHRHVVDIAMAVCKTKPKLHLIG